LLQNKISRLTTLWIRPSETKLWRPSPKYRRFENIIGIFWIILLYTEERVISVED
jgi:hypothetical protein